jgi:AraC-like DNA-binding protein
MQVITPAHFRPQVRIANRHAAAPGQSWGPRFIPDLQFIAVLRGSLQLTSGAEVTTASAGDVLCIRPGFRHTVSWSDDVPGEIAGMHLELIPDARWADHDYRSDPLPPVVTRPTKARAVEQAFIRAATVFSEYSRLRQPILTAIASEALLLLAEHWGDRAPTDAGPRTAAMVTYIRKHAVRGVDRHDLARHFDLTPEHINALFRRQLGLTPRDVLNHERCRLAYQLIHDQGVPVATAAAQVGYQDAFYFSRVFKSIYAVAPSRAR